jgi:hypothetical protein
MFKYSSLPFILNQLCRFIIKILKNNNKIFKIKMNIQNKIIVVLIKFMKMI